MFVIMQNFDNLRKDEIQLGNHAANIALAMKHAGTAITVTSLTDFIVFCIGATTVRAATRLDVSQFQSLKMGPSTFSYFSNVISVFILVVGPARPPLVLPVLRRGDLGRLLLPGHLLRGLPLPGPEAHRKREERTLLLLQAQELRVPHQGAQLEGSETIPENRGNHHDAAS